MNCYFCHVKLNKSDPDIFSSHDCTDCQEKYQLNSVTSTYKETGGRLQYAHIYLVTPDYKIVKMEEMAHLKKANTRHSTDSVNIQLGKKYHVRLNLLFNTTDIADCHLSGQDNIVTLPGFPITPANIRQKLPLYILFS